VRGIISGILFGCISLAFISVIFGIIFPKAPENFNIKAPDSSQFSNTIDNSSLKSEPSTGVYYNFSGITVPNTNRELNQKSSIKTTSKLAPMVPNTGFSSILQINQEIYDSPAQPKISDKNMDDLQKVFN
jgi:hypothetical protein